MDPAGINRGIIIYSCSARVLRERNQTKGVRTLTKGNAPLLSAILFIGLFGVAGTARAYYDGILSKQELTPDSYCHMKFPAMHRRSLAVGNEPELKSENKDDVIDFYGPCDESPSGKDQVQEQRLEEEHRFFESHAD